MKIRFHNDMADLVELQPALRDVYDPSVVLLTTRTTPPSRFPSIRDRWIAVSDWAMRRSSSRAGIAIAKGQ
jgi:hypothetical protein